ncbi:MAG: response regulator [Ktedonobacterales bacterium]
MSSKMSRSGGHEDAALPSASEPTRETTGPTIMVIDDSPSIRTILQASFARVGIHVLPFADGISAITAITSDEVPFPDLVLLDIGLPKMDGYEVARILRSNSGPDQLQFVMVTAHDGKIDRLHSRMLGAKFISKPFRVSAVVQLVCEMLGYPLPPVATTR